MLKTVLIATFESYNSKST